MNADLQKLKDKLDTLILKKSPTSPEVLLLSRKIDTLLTEYYKSQLYSILTNVNKLS